MIRLEGADVPSVSKRRRELVAGCDPERRWCLADIPTFSVSTTVGYAVGPHTDSGCSGTLESMLFTQPPGFLLPPGHQWLFAAAGVVVPLTSCCRLYVPPHVMHGTLPTSSTEPSYNHTGLGSAVVVKQSMVTKLSL